MCPTHHTVIDDDEEACTVERLSKIKATHEAQSSPLPEAEAAAVAETFIQSMTNVGQSGGFSAHTVNAAITVQNAPSTNHLTHQRQIQAIERLWQVICNLKGEFSLVVFLDNILTIEELRAYFRDGSYSHIADCVREYADVTLSLRNFSLAGANEATKERPFVTYRLWSIFFVLQGLYGRAALLLTNSYRAQRFHNWREDNGCDQLLRATLPTEVVDQVKRKEIGGLQIAIERIENQFLTEAGMNKHHPD
jgi:hypothetical protein